MSSRYGCDVIHGSEREASTRRSETVPTGCGPLGAGNVSFTGALTGAVAGPLASASVDPPADPPVGPFSGLFAGPASRGAAEAARAERPDRVTAATADSMAERRVSMAKTSWSVRVRRHLSPLRIDSAATIRQAGARVWGLTRPVGTARISATVSGSGRADSSAAPQLRRGGCQERVATPLVRQGV